MRGTRSPDNTDDDDDDDSEHRISRESYPVYSSTNKSFDPHFQRHVPVLQKCSHRFTASYVTPPLFVLSSTPCATSSRFRHRERVFIIQYGYLHTRLADKAPRPLASHRTDTPLGITAPGALSMRVSQAARSLNSTRTFGGQIRSWPQMGN